MNRVPCGWRCARRTVCTAAAGLTTPSVAAAPRGLRPAATPQPPRVRSTQAPRWPRPLPHAWPRAARTLHAAWSRYTPTRGHRGRTGSARAGLRGLTRRTRRRHTRHRRLWGVPPAHAATARAAAAVAAPCRLWRLVTRRARCPARAAARVSHGHPAGHRRAPRPARTSRDLLQQRKDPVDLVGPVHRVVAVHGRRAVPVHHRLQLLQQWAHQHIRRA